MLAVTPPAAAAVAGTMVNAIAAKWRRFFAPEGVEYELARTLAAVALALTGPGRIAVDRLAAPAALAPPRVRHRRGRARRRWLAGVTRSPRP
ncbi:hypothetical protein SHIRM173S_11467 [Streptomyces hirsutus]